MKGFLALGLLPLLASASPIRHSSSSDAKLIPNSYIVFFKGHVSPEAATAHHSWVQDLHFGSVPEGNLELRKRDQLYLADSIFTGLKHTYNAPGLQGYSGHFADHVVEKIRQHPDVSS